MSNTKISSNGINFLGLLCIAFIVLKLCKVIDWSWFWVLAPALFPLALVGLTILVVGILAVAVKVMENRK